MATPQAPSKLEWTESVLEQLVPVVEVHTQQSFDNHLGGSYIMEAQVIQVKISVVICLSLV